MKETVQKIEELEAYLSGLDPMYRGVAETAVEIVSGAFAKQLAKHDAEIRKTSWQLGSHEKRIKELQSRVLHLESERGVLCH